jgi:AraC-like DNA-binding protein
VDFKISINTIFPLLTLLQGWIFAIVLILRGAREERYSDRWLAFLLFLLGLDVVPFLLGWLGIDFLWEKLTFLPWDGFGWAAVPAMYLFLKSLINDQWRFSWRLDGKHFIPYFIVFLYHLIIGGYGLFNRDFVLNWWHQIENQYFISVGLTLLSYVQTFFYCYLGWKLYKEYRLWTETQFSDLEKVSFVWFRNFLLLFFIVNCAEFLNTIYLNVVSFGYDRMWLTYGANLFLTYYISISGFAQARVRGVHFVQQKEENEPKIAHPEPENTEGGTSLPTESTETVSLQLTKNTLSEEELSNWKTKVLRLIDTQKPYLQPDLTLSDLANQLKTNTSVISQVINTGFDKNFNDFINGYRVEEYLQKIGAPQYKHLTLLAVAFDCGFNSKTTFNRAFKKATGKAPSAF